MMKDDGEPNPRASAPSTSSFIIPTSDLKAAVFLDRDCTIIEDMEFSVAPRKLRPLPGALEGLRKLAGGRVSARHRHQPVGRGAGVVQRGGVAEVHAHMLRALAAEGIRIDRVYYCPHYAAGTMPQYAVDCRCRKPAPGMILRAARDLGVDLKKSWMIGDRAADIGAGVKAGCRTIRIGCRRTDGAKADFEALDLVAAAESFVSPRRHGGMEDGEK